MTVLDSTEKAQLRALGHPGDCCSLQVKHIAALDPPLLAVNVDPQAGAVNVQSSVPTLRRLGVRRLGEVMYDVFLTADCLYHDARLTGAEILDLWGVEVQRSLFVATIPGEALCTLIATGVGHVLLRYHWAGCKELLKESFRAAFQKIPAVSRALPSLHGQGDLAKSMASAADLIRELYAAVPADMATGLRARCTDVVLHLDAFNNQMSGLRKSDELEKAEKLIRVVLEANMLKNAGRLREALIHAVHLAIPPVLQQVLIERINDKVGPVSVSSISRARFRLDCAFELFMRNQMQE